MIVNINEPPEQLVEAAQDIHEWMDVNGHKDWEFLYIADRQLLDKTRRELEKYIAGAISYNNEIYELRREIIELKEKDEKGKRQTKGKAQGI